MLDPNKLIKHRLYR